MLTKSSVAV